jgi:chitinase
MPYIIFSGHLWTAKWWSQADTPGGKYIDSNHQTISSFVIGAAGDWTDDGPCTSLKKSKDETSKKFRFARHN